MTENTSRRVSKLEQRMSPLSDLINLDLSDVTEKIIAEYIWVDGSRLDLRSKARTLPGPVTDPSKLPKWNYDGSCRGEVHVPDKAQFILHPKAIFPDPFRGGKHILVMCNACNQDGVSIDRNRRRGMIISDPNIAAEEPGNGIEQKYALLQKEDELPLGSPVGEFDNPQGEHYCGVGTDKAFGRDIVDAHYKACLYAGIDISGINGEVEPGEWGYKVGPAAGFSPQSARYQLWIARYILERITETAGVILIPGAMFDRCTDKALKVIMLAQEEARRLGHSLVGTEHILLGLIGEDTGIVAEAFKSMGINLKYARAEVEKIRGRGRGFVDLEITFAPRTKNVFAHSLEAARYHDNGYIKPEHLLLGLLREPGDAVRVLQNIGADPNKLRTQVIRAVGGVKLDKLNKYGTNLSKLAEQGEIDAVVGRREQIDRVTQILGRRTKNNPCLIGEAGVGKTAIAEGLAQKIANGEVPRSLKGKKVFTLDVVGLVAGTSLRGQFEERMKRLLEEIKHRDDIILFIDELHTLIGAGAGSLPMDASNMLKPALARGQLRCIGATTLEEYRRYIEKDPALERRFQSVMVTEPTVEETIQILKGLQDRYETHHMVRYTDEALAAAAQLSGRYINDRFLPDKAIDLVDEAGSKVSLHHAQLSEEGEELAQELREIVKEKNEAVRNQDFKKAAELRDIEVDIKADISDLVDKSKEMANAESEGVDDGAPVVTEADIQHIVFSWTGIPVEKLSTDDSNRLLKMEETIHKRVIGQDYAVMAVSRAIRLARIGLVNPNRPIASFFFIGPTGVGKTEVAKALAACYFGSEKNMIRLDMSEFSDRHTISKLIGSPPGYIGYDDSTQLTEAVRRRPYTVVLFDEIEKAHSDIYNVMLQILEDGRLTDNKGRAVNFKNTLVIMTSNLGSNLIERGSSRLDSCPDDKEKDKIYNQIKSSVAKQLKEQFQPEFLNRLDDLIIFRQLTKPELKEIAGIMIEEVNDRLKSKGIQIEATEKFRDKVVEEGYEPHYGARPLGRAIERLLTDSIAKKFLACEIKEGDSAIVDIDSAGNVIILNGSSGAPPELSPELVVA